MKSLLCCLLLSTAGACFAAPVSLQQAYDSAYRYEQAGRYRAALNVLESAAEQTSRDYTLSLRLGWLAYHSGDYPQSESYYRAAIQNAPQAFEARLGLLLPLLAQNRWAEAEQAAYQVLQDDPYNYYATLRLCVALRAEGKLDLARRQGEKLLSRYPADADALSQQVLTLRAAGDSYRAQQLQARLRVLQPAPQSSATTTLANAADPR